MRMKSLTILVCAGLALAACSVSTSPPAPSQINTTTSMADVMNRVIDPVAQRMLRRSGSIDTAEGTKTILPASDAEWQLAENEATILIESGNLLLIPSRIKKLDDKDTDWVKYTNLMVQLAQEERAAIIAKDGDKMFDIGARIWDEACTGCHKKYVIPTLPRS